MRISEFIRSNVELILAEWDRFARCQCSGRDDGSGAAGPRQADAAHHRGGHRNPAERESSRRASRRDWAKRPTPAALRRSMATSATNTSSHLCNWARSSELSDRQCYASGSPTWAIMSESTVLEVIRFNESIDQAIAESMVSYVEATTEAQNMFLAVLGHDLRSPLASMSMAGRDTCPGRPVPGAAFKAGAHGAAQLETDEEHGR